jgi:hypothetical protein
MFDCCFCNFGSEDSELPSSTVGPGKIRDVSHLGLYFEFLLPTEKL